MLLLTLTLCSLMIATSCVPVDRRQPRPQIHLGKDPLEDFNIDDEYKSYMREVINTLEGDENIQQLIDENEAKNKPNIENYISMASQQTRSKLDELKRMELQRLKTLHRIKSKVGAEKKRTGQEKINLAQVESSHIDFRNPDSFSLVDLQKLIKKTMEHVSMIGKERKDAFKQYEMRKELKFRDSIKGLSNDALSAALQAHRDAADRHRKHPDLHHPISRAQLEEVWKRVDYMDSASFDPRLFFMLHDLDGDTYLSIEEIEALFQKELDKAYNSSNPDDDMVERNEEMNEMREHVFEEVDVDGDGMVSWGEFLASTKSEGFNKDSGWKTLDEQLVFSEEELREYERLLNPTGGVEPPVQPPSEV